MSVKIVINRGGIRELLRSAQAQSLVNRKAGAIARACNAQSSWGGYRVDTTAGEDRARARIYNISRNGQKDENRNLRMIRNLDAGRD